MNSYRVMFLQDNDQMAALTRRLSKDEAIKACAELEAVGTETSRLYLMDDAHNVYKANGEMIPC